MAAKISNRENNRILVQTGSISVISGQHFYLNHANCAPSGAVAAKSLCMRYSWWSGMKLKSQPTIILNLLAAKISNRENNRIVVQIGSMSVLSGQHFHLNHANCAPSGAVAAKSLCMRYSWWSGMKLKSQPTIILNLLAAKISNRENNRIVVQIGSMSVLSGQHFHLNHANCAPSGAVAAKSLCMRYSWWAVRGLNPRPTD